MFVLNSPPTLFKGIVCVLDHMQTPFRVVNMASSVRLVRRYLIREGQEMTTFMATCVECERVFNLLDENDANEVAYGHDCEQ